MHSSHSHLPTDNCTTGFRCAFLVPCGIYEFLPCVRERTMAQIMTQTCYFQAQFLIISDNTLIITTFSECIYHFPSKMAYPETLKMVGITTQTCPSYVRGKCMDPHNSNLEAISSIHNLKVCHTMVATDALTMHHLYADTRCR